MQESHGVGGESARESGEGPGNALRTHTGAGVREAMRGGSLGGQTLRAEGQVVQPVAYASTSQGTCL